MAVVLQLPLRPACRIRMLARRRSPSQLPGQGGPPFCGACYQNLAQSTRPMAPSSSRMMPHMISLFCRMRLLMVDRIWRLREMWVSTWCTWQGQGWAGWGKVGAVRDHAGTRVQAARPQGVGGSHPALPVLAGHMQCLCSAADIKSQPSSCAHRVQRVARVQDGLPLPLQVAQDLHPQLLQQSVRERKR